MKKFLFLLFFLNGYLSFSQVDKAISMGVSSESGYTKFGWTTDIMYQLNENLFSYNLGVSLNYNRNYTNGFPLAGINTAFMVYFTKERMKRLKPFFQIKYKVYFLEATCFQPNCKDRISTFHELFGGFGLKWYAAKGFFLISHIDLGVLIDRKFNGITGIWDVRTQINPMIQIGIGYDF